MRRDNTSGVTGVSYHRLTDTWLARIGHPRRTLGYFKTFEAAVAARHQAEDQTMGIYQYTLRADTKDVGALTIGHYQFAYKHSSWPNPALERKMASASYHAERAREKVTTRYFVVGRWEYAVEGLPIYEMADAPEEFTEELRHAPIVGVLRKIDGRYRVTAPEDWMVACNDRLRERLA